MNAYTAERVADALERIASTLDRIEDALQTHSGATIGDSLSDIRLALVEQFLCAKSCKRYESCCHGNGDNGLKELFCCNFIPKEGGESNGTGTSNT